MGYTEKSIEIARALVGKRVEMPVHYDCWARGARFGKVTKMGKGGEWVWVRLDHPGYKQSRKLWRMDYDYAKVVDWEAFEAGAH